MTPNDFQRYAERTREVARAARRPVPNRYDAATDRQYLVHEAGGRRFKLHFSEASQDAVFSRAYQTGTAPGWLGERPVYASCEFAYGVDALLEWEEQTGLDVASGFDLDLLLMAL
jgi:hypothetical protein